jgi:hypothetical protein
MFLLSIAMDNYLGSYDKKKNQNILRVQSNILTWEDLNPRLLNFPFFPRWFNKHCNIASSASIHPFWRIVKKQIKTEKKSLEFFSLFKFLSKLENIQT